MGLAKYKFLPIFCTFFKLLASYAHFIQAQLLECMSACAYANFNQNFFDSSTETRLRLGYVEFSFLIPRYFWVQANKLVVHANHGQFGSEKIYTPSNAFISNLQSITNISSLFRLQCISFIITFPQKFSLLYYMLGHRKTQGNDICIWKKN